jgi:predicted membrane-bound spermidine synthase
VPRLSEIAGAPVRTLPIDNRFFGGNIGVTGLLTGAQFSLSGSLRQTSIRQSSGEAFSADLLGSAIGIVLASVYLIPHLGLPMTGIVLAGLNVVALGVIAVRR